MALPPPEAVTSGKDIHPTPHSMGSERGALVGGPSCQVHPACAAVLPGLGLGFGAPLKTGILVVKTAGKDLSMKGRHHSSCGIDGLASEESPSLET